MMADQITDLRTLNKKNRAEAAIADEFKAAKKYFPPHETRMISITSGKGGVGKTNIAANLAYLLAMMNQKSMVLDADTGLANIDVILGINSQYNLYHVLAGEKTLAETLVNGPGGIKILPSASGMPEMTDLSRGQKLTLIDELNSLNESLDFLLIDTAAGISSNVMYFNMAAREIIVVTTPDPAAITDAYALIKILYQRHAKKRFRLIVNMVQNSAEAKEVYGRLSHATEHFLNLTIEYLGFVLLDNMVLEAVKQQKAFAQIYPEARATVCLRKIAEKICREMPQNADGNMKFFWESIIGRSCG